jgi:hypothetical protein
LVRVRYSGEDEFNAFDSEHLSLFNINSQSDLDMARALADGHAWPVRRPAGVGPLHLA